MELDVAPLTAVAQALTRAGIPFALGGSGLLFALGLDEPVRDWDLTTDADLAAGLAALGGPQVEVIGRSAFQTEGGTCRIPTVLGATWQGVPLGSAEAWAVADRLMGRYPKADLLSAYLRRHGARPETVQRLFAEPLPESTRSEVQSWE